MNFVNSRIAVLGAGIMGRSLGYELAKKGFQPKIIEAQREEEFHSSSTVAAGMVSPFCELEHSGLLISQLGQKGAQVLKKWKSDNPGWSIFFNGTLVTCHPKDITELQHLKQKLDFHGFQDRYLETETGMFFEDEGHVIPRELLSQLKIASEKLGASFLFGNESMPENYDFTFDCRGLKSLTKNHSQRGVRGDILEFYHPTWSTPHPIRLMHPRLPIYLVPHGKGHFRVGATMIETESLEPIKLSSMQELLSVVETIDGALLDANFIKAETHLRPAFFDNLPKVIEVEGGWTITGLFRHGYMLAPFLAKEIADLFFNKEFELITKFNINAA